MWIKAPYNHDTKRNVIKNMYTTQLLVLFIEYTIKQLATNKMFCNVSKERQIK